MNINNQSINEDYVLSEIKNINKCRILLLDENCSPNDVNVQRIKKWGYEIIKFPNHLRGRNDSTVINYAKQKKMGLITKDKKCAKIAKWKIQPVFLIRDFILEL
uniref:DUF5615 domain-containing protein n=1 Tax=Promethearchaeum syntrophicum TaxID=2594042 RepID=A0A5B9DFD2_9ARCH|nr:DUF5615 family PIN-like protein [Candidatus Prometheoarchaeum syntrophicum]QEE17755.1 hypothetical protein DSAG12_03593 [Candidatus Prometheoarchaeum syntrophicum]